MRTFLSAPIRTCYLTFIALLLLATQGCQHDPVLAINPPEPFKFPPETNAATQVASTDPSLTLSPNFDPADPLPQGGRFLRVGEKITVTITDLPPPGLQPHEQRIREDGTITLPYNITVQAAGKTPGQLEDAIRGAYVPELYLLMTVNVQNEERWFYVGGEVKVANRQPYLGHMTLIRAIQSAGDFTDYADKKRIQLTRMSGEKSEHNWKTILKKPNLDPEIFPGDVIHVPQRIW